MFLQYLQWNEKITYRNKSERYPINQKTWLSAFLNASVFTLCYNLKRFNLESNENPEQREFVVGEVTAVESQSDLRFDKCLSTLEELVHLPMSFRISSMRITGKATASTKSHSLRLRGTIPNTCARNGTYKMTKCKANEIDMASRSHGLTQGGMLTRLTSSDRALRELNISMATKTERDRVIAFTLPVWK